MMTIETQAEKRAHREYIKEKLKEFGEANIKIVKGAGMQKCEKCGEEKKLWDFQRTAGGGRSTICKACDIFPNEKPAEPVKHRRGKRKKVVVTSQAGITEKGLHCQINLDSRGRAVSVSLGWEDYKKLVEASL